MSILEEDEAYFPYAFWAVEKVTCNGEKVIAVTADEEKGYVVVYDELAAKRGYTSYLVQTGKVEIVMRSIGA